MPQVANNSENNGMVNEKCNTNAKSYLTLRRMAVLSLSLSIGLHCLFMLMFFFGESIIAGYEKSSSRPMNGVGQIAMPTGSDTLQFADEQVVEEAYPLDFTDLDVELKKLRFGKLMVHIAFSFLLLFMLFLYNRRMFCIDFSKKYGEVFFVVLGSLLITTGLSITFSYLLYVFDPVRNVLSSLYHTIRDCLFRDYLLMAVVIQMCYLFRLNYLRNKIAVENEELRTENIRSHYEALKHQLNPHFIFNSLNALQSLIDIDQERAGDYVQQLSSLLRHTLKPEDVVTLAEEMGSVEAYCSMMQIRYGGALKFDFQINDKYLNHQVLTLSILGLMENAIKHNVISDRQPFTVSVFAVGDKTLKVSNPIQPKQTEESGSGIGLSNLVERYRLQWNKEVVIKNNGNVFEVALPLIEPKKYIQ